MKVIDLLNKIADGNIPKNIRFNDMFMTYDEKKQNYFSKFGNEIDWKYTVMEYINDEIEIIDEEDKDIPLIPDDELYEISNQCKRDIYGFSKSGCDRDAAINYNFKVLNEKINQVVKEFNEYRREHNE